MDDSNIVMIMYMHARLVYIPTVCCVGSPSAPLNLSKSNVTNTSVILSWLPPEDGGKRDFSEIYYTITARG